MKDTDIRYSIANLDDEVSVLKTVLESSVQRGEQFAPMLVFYSDAETRHIVVVPKYYEDFTDRMTSIGEALHLFSAMKAHSVVVAMTNTMSKDDKMYNVLTLFVLSNESGWIVEHPFNVSANRSVTWHHDMVETTAVDYYDFGSDETGREMVSMMYHFTHLPDSIFRPAEILSYISSTGGIFTQINSKYQYFDVSGEL